MFPHNASIVSHTNIKITYWFVNTFSGYILCNIKISTIFFFRSDCQYLSISNFEHTIIRQIFNPASQLTENLKSSLATDLDMPNFWEVYSMSFAKKLLYLWKISKCIQTMSTVILECLVWQFFLIFSLISTTSSGWLQTTFINLWNVLKKAIKGRPPKYSFLGNII